MPFTTLSRHRATRYSPFPEASKGNVFFQFKKLAFQFKSLKNFVIVKMLTGPHNICIDSKFMLIRSSCWLWINVDSQSTWTPNECWLGVNIPNRAISLIIKSSECLSYQSECLHQSIRNQSDLYYRPLTSFLQIHLCLVLANFGVMTAQYTVTFAGMTAQYTVSVGFCSWTTQFKDARIAGLW